MNIYAYICNSQNSTTMTVKDVASLGGKATAKILREIALKKYYENPSYCAQCNKIIEVLEGKCCQVKRKKFCNRSCSAISRNINRPKKIKEKKPDRKLGVTWSWLKDKTKKEVFDKHKNWQSARTSIRRHAVYIYNSLINKKCCENCGYDKHIEICHKIAVSDFSDDVLINVINDVNNLYGLCPNCHWEFDNGLLKLQVRAGGSSALS